MYSRTHISLRVGETGIEMIDKIAEDTRTNRSEVIRAALSIALARPAQVTAHIQAKMASRKEEV